MSGLRERWLPIDGYVGAYEVSDYGRVRSLDRYIEQVSRWGGYQRRLMKGRVLTPSVDKSIYGYGRLTVSLCRPPVCGETKGQSQKTFLVHRLVALAFIGECPSGMEVAHNDGNASNNHLSNLRYDTPKGNCSDQLVHNTRRYGEKHHLSKLSDADVEDVRSMRGRVSITDLSVKYHVSTSHISRIWNNSGRFSR